MPNNNSKVDFRKELSGAMYQIKILLLLLWQGLNNKCKFRLRTEVADAEKFDDALFYQKKENGKFGIKFLQIKHARFEEANLVYKDFVDDFESTRCNLRKYFISFRKILQQFKEEELEDFILCTNIPFSSLMLKRKTTDNDNQALVFEEQREPDTLFSSLKHGEWKQYKLVQINDEVREIFRNSTNLSLLAEEMIDCIIDSNGKEKVELDLKKYWISLYHCALINNGIIEKKECVKLSWGFIKGNKKNASDFRTRFFDYLQQKTTLTETDLTNYNLEITLNEISDNAMKNTNLDNIDSIKLSAKILIKHVLAEDTMDLKYFFADDDSMLHDVMLICKENFNQQEADLDVYVEMFYTELKKQLLITLSKSSWHVSTNLQQIWNAENVNTENNVDEQSTTYQNLAKIFIEYLLFEKPLSDQAILVNNVQFLKLMFTYEEKFASLKFNDEFHTSENADIVELKECLINTYAAELFIKRENEVFPKTLVNFILDAKNPEIIEAYLLKPALFYEFKKIIKSESEWIFNSNFINGNDLNESQFMLRDALINKYQNKFIEHLIHHEFVVTDNFKELLKDKTDATSINSDESLKTFAKEVASCTVNKTILDKSALFETNKCLLNLIFEDIGEKQIKLGGKFLNISQEHPSNQNLPKYIFRRHFLKSYAIQKLKTVKFSLSENFGKRHVLVQKKHIEKFAAEIIEIFKKTKSMNHSNNILVYDKTKYSKNAVEYVIEDLKDDVFEVNRNEMINFHERFFDNNDSNLSENAKNLKQILETNLSANDFCDLKNCAIKITNSLPCFETIKEIGDIDDDIKNFLEKLLLVKTPSETLISEVIEKEVSQKFRLMDDMAADYLFKKVLNWAKEKEERFLEEHEAKSFMNDIEQKIIKSMITGTNSSYCAKLRSYGISFKQLLESPLESDTAQVIKLTTNQTLLTAIKMEQTLRHKDTYNYNIISTNALLPIQNEILESMNTIIDLLVIVDKTRPNEAKTFLNFWENLCHLIKDQPTKKVILITTNCWTSISNVIDQNLDDNKTNFIDLSKKSKRLFKNMPLALQGKRLCDSRILFKLQKYINSSVLVDFITTDEIKIGEPLTVFTEEEEKCYINRKIWLKKVFVDEDKLLKHIVDDKVVIISDKAGIGKSTFLTNLAQKFDEINLSDFKWKIRINLNLYTGVLSELNNEKKFKAANSKLNYCVNQAYEEIILRSLIRGTKQNPRKMSFQDHVFEHYFLNGKMLIIFDGFDEINPNYGDYVMQLLLILNNTTKNQIWIASRTNFEETLEKNLESFAHKLKPFNAEDQKEFLIKFWKTEWERKYNVPVKNQSRLEKYVKAILHHFYTTIESTHADEIGIPLLTKMLAESFEKNNDEENKTTKWHGCFDYLSEDDHETPEFSNKISNLFILYDTFVRQKIINYFLKEKQILDVTKTFNTKLIHTIYSYETKIHHVLGMMAMTKNNFEMIKFELPTESENEEIAVWMGDFRSGTENIGLIDSISFNGFPSFNHLTYAEYFAACYLKEKLLLTPKVAFEIMNKILEKDVPVFLHCMKHLLFPQESQESDFDLSALDRKLKGITTINYMASNGLYNCLRHFLTFNELHKNMVQDKTILHYAAESCQVNILHCILSHIYGFFEEHDKAYCLSLFLSLLDQNVKLNALIATIIEELKEFCESNLKYIGHESNQTFHSIMNFSGRVAEWFERQTLGRTDTRKSGRFESPCVPNPGATNWKAMGTLT